ncbi:MAG: ATP synthase F1 subunit gamma [Candidatus Krumholzibacteriia bacterium]
MAGAGIKIINKRIRSVRATQQITKAMKMVAASKLRRAQARLVSARPYAGKLSELLGHLAASGLDGHPLFAARPVKRRLYVVVTSDKGLCGAYNMNVIKLAQAALDGARRDGIEVAVYAVGKKARDYFGKRGYTLYESHADFGGDASADKARRVGDRCEAAFMTGEFDEVRLVYARFISTLTQRPTDQPLLPVAPPEAAPSPAPARGASSPAAHATAVEAANTDYIWEPGREALLGALLPLYMRNRVYLALCEAFASEHGARMASMSAATENAGELIDALTLRRNRERQATITQELSEIVGGANAL